MLFNMASVNLPLFIYFFFGKIGHTETCNNQPTFPINSFLGKLHEIRHLFGNYINGSPLGHVRSWYRFAISLGIEDFPKKEEHLETKSTAINCYGSKRVTLNLVFAAMLSAKDATALFAIA